MPETHLMLKRLLDFIISALLLVLLSPLLVFTWLVVRVRIGAPVFFFQERPGQLNKIFRLYKFRTMRDAFGKDGHPLADADRMTPTGVWVRRMSLDELPQLFNVLKGDMSLVGPRPLLVRYLDRYSPAQARRHLVRPGVTGWAQINGRNTLSWEQKFDLDVWYVDHQSLALDLHILIQTFFRVIRRDGISAEGEATNPEFMGSNKAQEGQAPLEPKALPGLGNEI